MQCGENHYAAVDPLLRICLFYVNMLDMTHLKDLQECRGERYCGVHQVCDLQSIILFFILQ